MSPPCHARGRIPLPAARPGQYLTVRVRPDEQQRSLLRNYSLSGPPDAGYYRITVKREAMIASGEQLDVWSPNWGGNGFASDRARGLLTDLTPLIQQDKFDTSVFVPQILKIYQSEGKTWGLPLLSTGSYVYYNMKLFDQAKVPYLTTDWDDTSWNWQKYVDTGKKLTQNPNDINFPDAVNEHDDDHYNNLVLGGGREVQALLCGCEDGRPAATERHSQEDWDH